LAIVKLRFTIETREAGIRALIAARQNLQILTAPLGARTRFARQRGVFSVGKATEKTNCIVFFKLLQSANL
jgi:hypothetical protein